MDLNTLGERLVEARKKRLLTQFQAAELMDISVRSLQGHESNKHRPSDKTINKYAHIYLYSKSYLLTGEIDIIPEKIPLYQGSKSELQDGEGFRGKTHLHEVEGTPLTDMKFKPKDGQVKGPLRAAIEGLGEIFDSNNSILIPAIQANIRTFQLSARREHQNTQQIKALQDKYDELEKRFDAHEKTCAQTSSPGPEEGNIDRKVM